MSQTPSLESRWTRLPGWAAQQLDGGIRSFAAAKELDFLRMHAYVVPNEHYLELFRKASKPNSDEGTPSKRYSAGWLVPDDPTKCNPVFIANSTLSAIWLLRETLPKTTLSEIGWAALARAAYWLTQDDEDTEDTEDTDEPPSRPRLHNAPLLSTKRPATTSQIPSPKRARAAERVQLSGPDRSSPKSLQEPESSQSNEPAEEVDMPSEEEPVLRTAMTNNNHRTERRRERERKAKALKKKRSLGLIEPREDAPPVEHAAYTSISSNDEPIVAWIIKQPIADSTFYNTTHTPYATAATMLQNAHTLGSQTARYHAASFLKSWRSLGTPFPTRAAPSSAISPAGTPSGLIRKTFPWMHDNTLSQPSSINRAFCHAWDIVNFYEGQLAAIHIQYRWAMAFLARAYAEKITMLEEEDKTAGRGQSRSRNGKGNLRTEAKKALLSLVFPMATSREHGIFKKRLQRATRWYEAADTLGWGSLCLMPHDQITNTWVEQTLRVGEWRIWLDLVMKVNPDAYAASKAFDSWLGSESIAGGSIDGKELLRIEAESTTIYEVEEAHNNEDEEDFAPTQSQIIVPSVEPARPLRQLTLPELFKPQPQFSLSEPVSTI